MSETAKDIILGRYADKCRLAGGPRVGYVLRKQAILYAADDHPGTDLENGLEALVADGLLKSSETRDFYFLTAAGVEKLSSDPHRT